LVSSVHLIANIHDSVNEIFNPSRINSTFNQDPILRSTTLTEDKGTNYGVVRLPLLEHIYETLYMQRISHGNTPAQEATWPHRIMPHRRVTAVTDSPVRPNGIRLQVRDSSPLYLCEEVGGALKDETLDVDAVFVATGYFRDLHETLLKDARHLMPGGALADAKWTVQRDYRVRFADERVSGDAGVWLQGCCETTHGVSEWDMCGVG
jgi:L-ornithine N5-oxygenase